MGSDLSNQPEGSAAPNFVITAVRDPQSAPLQRIQVIKGWVSAQGEANYKVYDVAGGPDRGTIGDIKNSGAAADTNNGETVGDGHNSLCAVFTDPDFDANQPAYYYARVVENPTARWSFAQCASLPEEQRPTGCDNDMPKMIQEMAWTSPIWYRPTPENYE